MKKDDYIYCNDLDEVCEWVNRNFEVLERRIRKTNKRINRNYILLGGAIGFLYCKFSDAIDNMKIKYGNF